MSSSLSLIYIGTLPRYNWNIAESGIKHHNSDPLYWYTCVMSSMAWAELKPHRYKSERRLVIWSMLVHMCNQF